MKLDSPSKYRLAKKYFSSCDHIKFFSGHQCYLNNLEIFYPKFKSQTGTPSNQGEYLN